MREYFSAEHGEAPRVPYQDSLHRGRHSIEERMARVVYEGYKIAGHGSQSFERLHERGGFGVEEMIHLAFIAGRGSAQGVKFGDELASVEGKAPR